MRAARKCTSTSMLIAVLALAATFDAEGAHAPIEVAAIHAEQFGGARDVAFRFDQFALDEVALVRFARLAEGGELVRRGRGRVAAEGGQVVRRDALACVHDADAL